MARYLGPGGSGGSRGGARAQGPRPREPRGGGGASGAPRACTGAQPAAARQSAPVRRQRLHDRLPHVPVVREAVKQEHGASDPAPGDLRCPEATRARLEPHMEAPLVLRAVWVEALGRRRRALEQDGARGGRPPCVLKPRCLVPSTVRPTPLIYPSKGAYSVSAAAVVQRTRRLRCGVGGVARRQGVARPVRARAAARMLRVARPGAPTGAYSRGRETAQRRGGSVMQGPRPQARAPRKRR
jgi:hypothetical protein